MPKTKISEFSATPGNNTDIDGINIAEGCAPSGINDAIRELMAQLKDFQAGTAGDSFNGPIGATTPAAGTFTNLSASGTFALTGDQVQISEGGTGQTTANAAFNALAPSQSTHAGKYLKTDGTNTSWDALDISTADITGTLPIANGGTGLTALGTGVQTALGIAVGSSGAFVTNGGALGTPSSGTVTNLTGTASININGTVGATTPTTGAFTTLSASGNITVSGGTANGVAYLNGSKVLTTGSALVFDSSNRLSVNQSSSLFGAQFEVTGGAAGQAIGIHGRASDGTGNIVFGANGLSTEYARIQSDNTSSLQFGVGASGSEQMRLTSTGLGIGTSSPASKIQAYAGTSVGASHATFGASATGYWNFNSGGAGSDRVIARGYNSSATEAVRLDPAGDSFLNGGNLGIGTSSPTNVSNYKSLSISGSSGSLADMFVGSTLYGRFQTDATYGLLITSDPNNAVASSKIVFDVDGTERARISSDGTFRVKGAGTAGSTDAVQFAGSAPASSLTLSAAGGLSIGTTTDAGAGNIRVNGGALIGDGTAAAPTFTFYNESNVGIFRAGAGVLGFSTAGSERARITSGGDLLVGTTDSSATSGAGTKLIANGQYFGVMAASTNSDTTLQVYSTGAAAYRFYVGLGGTVYATNTTISAISDQRFKENIVDLDVGLNAVMALKPRKFDWKSGKGKDIKGDRGFIAQEFEQVFPDLIDEWKDPAPEGEEPYKSVRQDLIPVLVKAIQEQQAIITDLRARVAQLEAK